MPRYRIRSEPSEGREDVSVGGVITDVFGHSEAWGYSVTDIAQTSGVVYVSLSHALDAAELEHIGLEEDI